MSIAELRERLKSGNWKAACDAADQISALDSSEAYQVLIEAISSDSPIARNSAALAVRAAKLQKAVPALLTAIMNPANANNRGTLVYALEEMDCNRLFLFLFRLVLEGNYECRSIALGILANRDFYVTDTELNVARNVLTEHIETNAHCSEELFFADLSEILEKMQTK